jgi:hypothetical protein
MIQVTYPQTSADLESPPVQEGQDQSQRLEN